MSHDDPSPLVNSSLSASGNTFNTHKHLLQFQGNSRPLPDWVLRKMKRAFRYDFSRVRIHVGWVPAEVDAVAFAYGEDLYFLPGLYQPETAWGFRLLAHELAHVVQQTLGKVPAKCSKTLEVIQSPELESEADEWADMAIEGKVVPASALVAEGNACQAIQRAVGFELELRHMPYLINRVESEKDAVYSSAVNKNVKFHFGKSYYGEKILDWQGVLSLSMDTGRIGETKLVIPEIQTCPCDEHYEPEAHKKIIIRARFIVETLVERMTNGTIKTSGRVEKREPRIYYMSMLELARKIKKQFPKEKVKIRKDRNSQSFNNLCIGLVDIDGRFSTDTFKTLQLDELYVQTTFGVDISQTPKMLGRLKAKANSAKPFDLASDRHQHLISRHWKHAKEHTIAAKKGWKKFIKEKILQKVDGSPFREFRELYPPDSDYIKCIGNESNGLYNLEGWYLFVEYYRHFARNYKPEQYGQRISTMHKNFAPVLLHAHIAEIPLGHLNTVEWSICENYHKLSGKKLFRKASGNQKLFPGIDAPDSWSEIMLKDFLEIASGQNLRSAMHLGHIRKSEVVGEMKHQLPFPCAAVNKKGLPDSNLKLLAQKKIKPQWMHQIHREPEVITEIHNYKTIIELGKSQQNAPFTGKARRIGPVIELRTIPRMPAFHDKNPSFFGPLDPVKNQVEQKWIFHRHILEVIQSINHIF